MAAYLAFLGITLVPTLVEATIPQKERVFYTMMLSGIFVLLGPIVQILGVAAGIAQARKINSTHMPHALSLLGLVVQSAVFLAVGVSFIFRFRLPDQYWDRPVRFALKDWYWRVGWATVNNIIFALVQGMLAALVWWRRRNSSNDETAPLLAR